MAVHTKSNSYSSLDVHLDPKKSTLLSRKHSPLPQLLYDLLIKRSPSRKEDSIRAMLLEQIKEIPGVEAEVDQRGNLWAWVGGKKVHETVFSSHMDTVHSNENKQRLISLTAEAGVGKEGMVYAVEVEGTYEYAWIHTDKWVSKDDISAQIYKDGGKFFVIASVTDEDMLKKYGVKSLCAAHSLEKKDDPLTVDNVFGYFKTRQIGTKYLGSVLGADDKLGCYAMIELMRTGVHGTYIFHVEEESGAGGSAFVRDNLQDRIKGSKRAVAFDRAGYSDVIGSQRGGQCCSLQFGRALAAALNEHMPPKLKYRENVTGMFTDTANYIRHIPECTNLSVGYFNQHGHTEHFDSTFFLDMFMPAIKKVNWDALPTHRSTAPAATTYNYGDHTYGSWRDDESWAADWIPAGTSYPGAGTGCKWSYTKKCYMLPPPEVKEDTTSDLDNDPNMSGYVPKDDKEPKYSVPTNTDQLSDIYYTSRGYDAPWKLVKNTAFERIPEWRPELGNYGGKANHQQMQIMIGAWILLQPDYIAITNAIAKLVAAVDALSLVEDSHTTAALEASTLLLKQSKEQLEAKCAELVNERIRNVNLESRVKELQQDVTRLSKMNDNQQKTIQTLEAKFNTPAPEVANNANMDVV